MESNYNTGLSKNKLLPSFKSTLSFSLYQHIPLNSVKNTFQKKLFLWVEKSTSKSCYSTHLVAVWGCRLSYGTMDRFSDLMGSSSLLCLSKHPSPGRFYHWPTSSGRAFPGKAGNMWLKICRKGFWGRGSNNCTNRLAWWEWGWEYP